MRDRFEQERRLPHSKARLELYGHRCGLAVLDSDGSKRDERCSNAKIPIVSPCRLNPLCSI